jgi:surfactin synthase thioesterase subunit
MTGIDCDQWFPLLSNGGAAGVRLCCFTFAGGSASAFGMWAASLPPWVELRALQLPGRAGRLREPPISSMEVLVPMLRRAIEPLTDVPLVFFGHSNGALIAYELARELRRRSAAKVQYIVLSSKPAPYCGRGSVCRHRLDDEALIAELARFGGTPAELLDNRDFMMLMLPAIRADFALAETHHFAVDEKLDLPVELWWGREDPVVEPGEVQAWQRYLKRPATLRDFHGGHFYLQQSQAEVMPSLLEILHAARRPTARPS